MKKGISDSKVKRMRNLLTGDYKKRTNIRSGYTKINEDRVEGDVWEEKGKRWTIKNGIKQNISKLESVRDKFVKPICCPKCNGSMNHKMSTYSWRHFGFCKSCLSFFEMYLKIQGKWKDYLKRVNDNNFESWMVEAIDEYTEWADSSDSKPYVTEAGEIEGWDSKIDKVELKKKLKKDIKKVRKKYYGKNK